ncbi:MAG: type II toxin-antitoxin system VapC family toxin [Thermoanaerobaculia bacterium]|nr:type II toxin-antitoxin system VapC family toxin [Thermoanaerobaculia bacterium]
MIVLDASATVELLLGTARGAAVARRIFDPAETLHAPELLDLEVAQVLRRYERAKILDETRAEAALRDLADLPIERYGHRLLLPRAWELRANLTIYDAVYVALAELLGAPLLTGDVSFEAAKHRASIELLAAS